MSDTTTARPTISAAKAMELLAGLDSNGVDYFVLGVATHIVREAVGGAAVTMAELGDTEDESVIDAVNELLELGYVEQIDGALLPVPYVDLDDAGIDPAGKV